MKSRIVNVDIDAMPGNICVHSVSDYIGIQVLAPTALPLFQYNYQTNALECLGATEYSISSDGCIYDITVRDDLFWSDGTLVTAKDYLRSFLDVLGCKKNFYRFFLKDIENYREYVKGNTKKEIGIKVEGRKLIFRLIKSNFLFCKFLSIINFSPKHSYSGNLAAGAYVVENVEENKIVLKKNVFFSPSRAKSLLDVEFIHYIKPNSRYDALEKYEQGKLDITCDTMFPFEKLPIFKGRKDFYREPNHICMILHKEKASHPLLEEASFRKAILFSLNRTALCTKFNFAVTPMCDFFFDSIVPKTNDEYTIDFLYNQELAERLFKEAFAIYGVKEVSLKVAFSDYFPNKEVLEHFAIELKQHNVNLELIYDDFLAPSASADIRLHLWASPFHDPFSFYLTEAYAFDFAKKASSWKIYVALLDYYQKCRTHTERKHILEQLNSILINEAYVIPLFKMQSLYLKRSGVEHFNFIPGKIWKKERV